MDPQNSHLFLLTSPPPRSTKRLNLSINKVVFVIKVFFIDTNKCLRTFLLVVQDNGFRLCSCILLQLCSCAVVQKWKTIVGQMGEWCHQPSHPRRATRELRHISTTPPRRSSSCFESTKSLQQDPQFSS